MPFTVTMPKLSPTMEAGTIVKWHKKVGDFVKPGDVLFEVATDKATVEHAALDGGWLRQVLVANGQEAIVNQAVAIFTEKQDESIEGYKPSGVVPELQKEMPSVPEALPSERGESPASAKKQTPPLQSFQGAAFVPEPPLEEYTFGFPVGSVPEGRIAASPLAKKLAKEKRIDLIGVKGSGPHGRIMSRDLAMAPPSTGDGSLAFGQRELPSTVPGTYEEEPLSPMRKVIASRLQQSKTFVPHFYVTQEIRADRLCDVYQQLKGEGIKISYNDFVVKASALALEQHPNINSGFNSETLSIIRFKTIDISIAVTVEAGLITPIVRHANYKNLGQISAEVKELAKRAKEGKLARHEYMGGSFTLSNLGMFGVTAFSGILNPPQAALLAVGGIEEKPVVEDGKIVPGKTMSITLSADHRVIDGAEGAKFIKAVQKLLENPALLLLN